MKKNRTAKEKRYLDKLSKQGCIVCKLHGPISDGDAEIHHIRAGQGAGQRSSDYLSIPLCAAHHRTGGANVAIHAGQISFEMLYGAELDLLAATIEEMQE